MKLVPLALVFWAWSCLARFSEASAQAAGEVVPQERTASETRTYTGCGAYCSNGHVQSYVGPLDTTRQVATALKQLSFKREIIITHHADLGDAIQVSAFTKGVAQRSADQRS